MHEAFERYIAENPDEVGGYAAYADWLQERGDPRGEFMAVQLALEDEARPKADRDALKAREAELLARHEREWLGELAGAIFDGETLYGDRPRIKHRFLRGWVSELVFEYFRVDDARAFARSAEARFVSRVAVEDPVPEATTEGSEFDSVYEPGPDVPADVDPWDRPSLLALAAVPHVAGLRALRLGEGSFSSTGDTDRSACHTNGAFAHQVVAQAKNLEELYLYAHSVQAADLFRLPMPRLRVLRYDHETEYPLEILAANPTLGNLTHLSCHPHGLRADDDHAYIRLDQLRAVCRSSNLRSLQHLRLRLTDFGDDGVDEIVASGLLGRLRVLDLSYGCVTDRGAAALAASPDLKGLEFLDLTMNAIGPDGVRALEATGVNVTAERQHDEHPDRLEDGDYLDYLCHGDME